MEIKTLDSRVVSKIRSSFNVNSVSQCVFQLVCNSLDAKSTAVAVRINLVTFRIQVADNGEGITKENMQILGERYATNKCRGLEDLERNLKTYGFRGEAIPSIVEMCSSVKVSSRFKRSSETYSKILSKNFKGEIQFSKLRSSKGTTVTILGWLSTVPVRQQRIVQEIELEEVKKEIERLVIINPDTSFTLRNDVTGLLLLNCPKNIDIVGSFCHLHPEINDSFTLLKVSKGKVSIEMLIQKELFLSKKFQYVYVNKKPAKSTKILSYVHKALCGRNNCKAKALTLCNTKRYPVYVMNIKCPSSYVDNLTADVEFTCWNLVLTCIAKIIRTFLGLEEDKEKVPVQQKIDKKFDYGVSQLLGAVQASAFKRKSDETNSGEYSRDGNVPINKSRRLEDEYLPNLDTQTRQAKHFVKDKTILKASQLTGNYQIEDSGKDPGPSKLIKIKSIIKRPLAINVKPKAFEEKSKIEVEPTFCGKERNNGVDREVFRNKQSAEQTQFDQRSVYSRLNTDEDQGKNLIMDMFLKSTQIFKDENEDEFDQPSSDVSKETVEESNFIFNNNVQDNMLGINTTMSISVNVKKKKMRRTCKGVQTSISDGKLTSKCVQTSQFGYGDFPKILEARTIGNVFLKTTGQNHELLKQNDILKTLRLNNLHKQYSNVERKQEYDVPETDGKVGAIEPKGILVDNKYIKSHYYQAQPQVLLAHNKISNPTSKIPQCENIQNTANTEKVLEECISKKADAKMAGVELKKSHDQSPKLSKLPRRKSYQTDLVSKLDGFTLGPNDSEVVGDNYTILIKTVSKKENYLFVKKSEDIDQRQEITAFRPLKICHCNKEDGNLFRFEKQEVIKPLNLRERADLHLPVAKGERKINENLPGYHETIHKFREGTNLIDKGEDSSLPFRNDMLPKNNILFRGAAKRLSPKKRAAPLCGKSPYFLKKCDTKDDANVCDQSIFERFLPVFKSTQISTETLRETGKLLKNYSNEYSSFKDKGKMDPSVNAQGRKRKCDYCKACNENKNTGVQNINQEALRYFRPSMCNKYNNPYDPYQRSLNRGIPNCATKRESKNYYPEYCGMDCQALQELRREDFNGRIEVCYSNIHPRTLYRRTNDQCIGVGNQFQRKQPEYYLREKESCLNNKYLCKDVKPRCSRFLNDPTENTMFFRQNNVQQFDIENMEKEYEKNNYVRQGNKRQTYLHHLPRLTELDEEKKLLLLEAKENTHWAFSDLRDQHEDDEAYQTVNLSDPRWCTPNLSNGNLYLEPTIEEKFNAEVEKPYTNVEEPEEKMFNFKMTCSPNIFSGEVDSACLNNPHSNRDMCKNAELFEVKPQETDRMDLDDLNSLCNVADYGLVSSQGDPAFRESSNLEISLPNKEERQKILEKELLEIKRNIFSWDTEVKTVAESKTSQVRDDRSRIIVDSQNEWLKHVNENGIKFFANKRTGMVTIKTPVLFQKKFDFDERLDFVPKGMSPVLKEHKKIDQSLSQNAKSKLHDFILEGYQDELLVIKWQHFIGNDPKPFFEEIYKEKTKQFETCIPTIHESNFRLSKDFMSFSNKMFKTIEVIGQVDKKFIAAREKTKNLLILFDQHAVHERIRLEKFLEEYRGIKAPCHKKLTIFMPNNDINLLKKHSLDVESLGLSFEFFSNGLRITEMPLCIEEKFNNKENIEDLSQVLNALMKDILELLKCTRGSTTKLMPKIIQNIMNLKACRGAIKFGDLLSTQQCENLLKDLSTCKLPFQCAHGRPTLTPILTLSKVQLKVQRSNLNLKKLLHQET